MHAVQGIVLLNLHFCHSEFRWRLDLHFDYAELNEDDSELSAGFWHTVRLTCLLFNQIQNRKSNYCVLLGTLKSVSIQCFNPAVTSVGLRPVLRGGQVATVELPQEIGSISRYSADILAALCRSSCWKQSANDYGKDNAVMIDIIGCQKSLYHSFSKDVHGANVALTYRSSCPCLKTWLWRPPLLSPSANCSARTDTYRRVPRVPEKPGTRKSEMRTRRVPDAYHAYQTRTNRVP
jgi:hypothetical protein